MPRAKDPAFFISLTGKRLIYACVHPVFRALVDTAGVGIDAPHRPRLHELRHTFAVRTLLHWYRTEDTIPAKTGRRPPLVVHLYGTPLTGLCLLVPVGGPGTARTGRHPPRRHPEGSPGRQSQTTRQPWRQATGLRPRGL